MEVSLILEESPFVNGGVLSIEVSQSRGTTVLKMETKWMHLLTDLFSLPCKLLLGAAVIFGNPINF